MLTPLPRVLLSVLENKVSVIKVVRSILRENVRRNMRGEETMEKNSKEQQLVPNRGHFPSAVKLGEFPTQKKVL